MAQSRGRFDSSSLFLRLGAPCAVAALACGVASAQNSAAWPFNGASGSSMEYSNVDALDGVAIGAGFNATFVLRADGKIAAWGSLANRLQVPQNFPSGVAELSVGFEHAVARLGDGTVYSWGSSTNAVPANLGPVRQVSAGLMHSIAVKHDGTVVGWGQNIYGETVSPVGLVGVKRVAAGGYFSMALKQDGTVACFGNISTVPSGLSGVVAIDGGYSMAGAVRQDGTVVTWNTSNVPAGLSNVVAIDCGFDSNIALRSDGSVATWGFGQGIAVPAGLPAVRAIAAEFSRTRLAVLTVSGTVIGWGGFHGPDESAPIVQRAVKLRGGGTGAGLIAAIDPEGFVTAWQASATSTQADVPADLGAVDDVAVGATHCLALTRGGVVRGWGGNTYNEITVPTDLGAVVGIAAGAYHSLAIRSTTAVRGWGRNNSGQATPPPGLSGVVQVAGGGDFSGALRSDGSVVCWGPLGASHTTVPPNLGQVRSIALGSTHSLALRTDGSVIGWGSISVPPNLGQVKSIAAYGGLSAAIKPDGSVATWGVSTTATPSLVDPAVEIAVVSGGFVARLCRTPEYERWSGDLGPVGFGTPRSFTFSSLPQAAGPVTVTVRARGNFLAATQYLDVTLEAETGSVARLFQSNATNCPVSPDVATFEISAAQFAARTSDGALTIVLRPSFTVQTGACIDGYSEIGLTYNTLPFDCNSNGIEDACEISDNPSLDCNGDGQIDSCQPLGPADDCDGDGQRDACQIVAGAPDDDFDGHLDSCEYARGDFDLDGTVGAPDLGILLALWGIPKPPAGDFNGDGAVGAPDLAIFLARWGPVVWP